MEMPNVPLVKRLGEVGLVVGLTSVEVKGSALQAAPAVYTTYFFTAL
jgi:hypothetical protein